MCWEWFKNKEQLLQRQKRKGFLRRIVTGNEKIDSLQKLKEKKVMGAARSCFYVVGSAEYSHCEGYAVYLVGPGRCYLLGAVETERNHHVAKPVKTYLETLKWKVLPHPPYCPDIAPTDYYLFRSMAYGLADQQFRSNEDIEKWLDSWIASKDEFFHNKVAFS